jgi:hypothetical protein
LVLAPSDKLHDGAKFNECSLKVRWQAIEQRDDDLFTRLHVPLAHLRLFPKDSAVLLGDQVFEVPPLWTSAACLRLRNGARNLYGVDCTLHVRIGIGLHLDLFLALAFQPFDSQPCHISLLVSPVTVGARFVMTHRPRHIPDVCDPARSRDRVYQSGTKNRAWRPLC